MEAAERVLVLGAGSIGVSFAAAFADAGAAVTLVEPAEGRRAALALALSRQEEAIAAAGLARGGGGHAAAGLAGGGAGHVAVAAEAGPALAAAGLVIEAGPERLEVKQAIFAGLLAGARPDAVLATASSAMPMSRIVPEAADQRRCLVAHPVNPPAVLRLVELVPAPGTAAATLGRARAVFEAAGFVAVTLGREVEGFVLNRLQGAVLREAYRLVGEGVVDVAGVEAVMRLGLGPRWALSGPFETAELNTPGGIRAHAERMGPAYRRMGEERGETAAAWPEALVARVEAERRAAVPADALEARAAWRARAVARLVALRDRLDDA